MTCLHKCGRPSEKSRKAAGNGHFPGVNIGKHETYLNHTRDEGCQGRARHTQGRGAELAENQHIVKADINRNGDTAANDREHHPVYRPQHGHIHIGQRNEGIGEGRYLQILCPKLYAVLAGGEDTHHRLWT